MRVIIIGAGEVGFHIAEKLSQENKEVVVVDKQPEVLARISEHMDVQTLVGSGSSPLLLEEAGIKDADILLAVTDSDEINLIACTFANILAPGITKLARIRSEEYVRFKDALSEDKLDIAMVINPEVEVIKSIERIISSPGTVDAYEFCQGAIHLLGIRVEPGTLLADTKLIDLRGKTGDRPLIIAAIMREERLIIPRGDDTIRAGDLVYFVCEKKDEEHFLDIFGVLHKARRNILIIGGGNIGLRLAKNLEMGNYHVKLIERSTERCQYLSEQLNKTIVLQGDGTDQVLLKQENIDDIDLTVTVTSDEETNILCSLLAKRMGGGMAITRINKSAYLPLVHAIGIEHTVTPRLSAVNTILHHIRGGNVVCAITIKDDAEVLEAEVGEKSDIAGRPIKAMKFPKGSIILCLLRENSVVIPTGETVIQTRDRIVILAIRKAIPKVEKLLAVRLGQA